MFLTFSVLFISCSTEPETNNDSFLVKVDSIGLSKTIALGDTLHIAFYGTIGNNGGYAFDRFESNVENNSLGLKVWGTYKSAGAQAAVMVYLDGRTFGFVPTTKGDYTIVVYQPGGTTIEDSVVVQ